MFPIFILYNSQAFNFEGEFLQVVGILLPRLFQFIIAVDTSILWSLTHGSSLAAHSFLFEHIVSFGIQMLTKWRFNSDAWIQPFNFRINIFLAVLFSRQCPFALFLAYTQSAGAFLWFVIQTQVFAHGAFHLLLQQIACRQVLLPITLIKWVCWSLT